MDELTLATTVSILEELKSRYETLVFIGRQGMDKETSAYSFKCEGDLVQAIGLCEVVKEELMTDLREAQRESMD